MGKQFSLGALDVLDSIEHFFKERGGLAQHASPELVMLLGTMRREADRELARAVSAAARYGRSKGNAEPRRPTQPPQGAPRSSWARDDDGGDQADELACDGYDGR